MATASLTELRLARFKSYDGQRLAIRPLTLLMGRNGSGKSNVLDALSLLALLAEERDVSDLERGDKDVAGLRGGLSGAAPFGGSTVEVGCSISSAHGLLRLDVCLDASDHPEVITETLRLQRPSGSEIQLLKGERQSRGAGIANVSVYSRGAPRSFQMLSSRLCTAQAPTKIPQDSEARRLVADCSEIVLSALRSVFVLDPVPGAMRSYARIGSLMTRDASTMSAVVHKLWRSPEMRQRLLDLVQALVEADVRSIEFVESRLPDDRLVDVMLAMRERFGRREFIVPAQLMSDGTLRYLAIVTSLLDQQHTQATDAPRTLVVEEIENGLFPSQAERVLDLLKAESAATGTRLVATTHSPALLDALRPEDHAGVVICERNGSGWSSLTPLVEHARYIELAAAGEVGRAVTKGVLEGGQPRRRALTDVFG